MLLEPTLSDLEYICLNLRQADKDEIYGVLPHDNPFLLARQTMDIAGAGGFVTVAHARRPVSVLGFHEQHPGVLNVFAYATDEFHLVAYGLTRFALKDLKSAMLASGAHRAQCDSRYDHYQAHRWLECFGFTAEGQLKAYGKDASDYIRFAYVKETPCNTQN